jgi:archaellum component FlaF (FlaF/FlaG flagellin family)
MKSNFKYTITIFLSLLVFTQLTSCTKDTSGAEINLANQMIADKTWQLDFSIEGTNKKNYSGQSTYTIDFTSVGKKTKDSDGLDGTYEIKKVGSVLQIQIQAKTSGKNDVSYVYNIESIATEYLVLYYTLPGLIEPTKLYFTLRR